MNSDLDFVVSTGEYIEEWLEDNHVSPAELARRLGCSRKHVSELLRGAPLSHEFAIRLARVTGIPADRWMQLESFYRSELARLELEQDPAEVKAVLSTLPLSFLRKRGYIRSTLNKPGKCAFEVLSFYKVGSLDVLREALSEPAVAVAFRQSAKLDWGARLTWLKAVEAEAAQVDLDRTFDRDALRALIPELRALTRESPGQYGSKLLEALRGVGVRLVFVHAVPKAGTYGAARWYHGAPLVALSLHRKSEDQLWFTLFHELFHVLEHDLTPEGFVSGEWADGKLEDAADKYSRDLLVPPERTGRLVGLESFEDVRGFATELGVSPGIVVGRLHREQIWPYSKGQGLIQKLVLVEDDDED